MARETSPSPPAVKASASGSRTVFTLSLTFEVSFGKSLLDVVCRKRVTGVCVSLNSVASKVPSL